MGRIRVRVQAGAREDRVVGWQAGALQVRVRARAIEGRANEGVIALLAGRLGIAKGRLSIVSGDKSRGKMVEIEGMEEQVVREVLGA